MLSPVVLTVINNALLPQNTQSFFMIVRRQGFTDATLQNYLLAANHAKSAKKIFIVAGLDKALPLQAIRCVARMK